jgi:16S rRNA (cytosine967-C5)-methyltransferase
MAGIPGTGRAQARAGEARRVALRVLHSIEVEGAFANLALDEFLERGRLSPADRALATELVYGVTRWRGRLDFVLDSLSRRPVRELPAWIRNILRLGLYQILYLDRVPVHAAVSESVALAHEFGHRGTAGLVNAVLRRAARDGHRVSLPKVGEDPAVQLAVELSHPEWIVRRWLGRYGLDRTRRLCLAGNESASLTLRANLLRCTRPGLIERLAREGVAADPGSLFPEAVVCRRGTSIGSLAAHQAGLCSVQDEAAMSAARVVAPRPEWLVIDACAGVGGKATHLAEMMGDRGRVVAIDLHEHKLRLLGGAARRLRLRTIETRVMDARDLADSDLAGTADAVLVDAPCSGLGVLRRRPDLRWRLRPEDLHPLTSLQREILTAAAACVRPGGVLVYATCSIEPEENEEIVEGFLASNLEFEAGNAAETLAASADGGRAGAVGKQTAGGAVVFIPEQRGPDGFFVARLVRRRG